MGQCSIRFTNGQILNHKSDSNHADNDWLCIVWITDTGTITRQFQVLERGTGSYVLNDGAFLSDLSDFIDCSDSSIVTATVMVTNLSSVDLDKQVEIASKFVQDAAILIARAYLTVGAEALGMASTLIAGLPALGALLAKAGQLVINQVVGKLGDVIHGVFDSAVTPALEAVISEIDALLGGKPNCNGEVLHDTFVFAPHTDRDETISKTYTGPQKNSRCGNAPHTSASWQLHRDAMPIYTPLDNLAVPGLIYALTPRLEKVQNSGGFSADRETWDLLWYNHTGWQNAVQTWQGPRKIGNNWDFQQVVHGVNGSLYALDKSGVLQWYSNTGYLAGVNKWAGPRPIGSSFQDFLGIFCDSSFGKHAVQIGGRFIPVTQVLYAIQADGALLWYRHEQPISGDPTWTNGGVGKVVDTGWVAGYQRVFSGGNGILYAIGDDGSLYWSQHLGFATGEAKFTARRKVGSAWNSFVNVFSIGGGILYAIDSAGQLFWFRHNDQQTGGSSFDGPKPVGSGWNANGFSAIANSVNVKNRISPS